DARYQRPSNECRRVPRSTARSRRKNNALSKCVTLPLRSRPTFSEAPLPPIFVTDSQPLPFLWCCVTIPNEQEIRHGRVQRHSAWRLVDVLSVPDQRIDPSRFVRNRF